MKWTDVGSFISKSENPWDHNPWKDRQKQQGQQRPQNSEELDELIRKSQKVLQGLFNQKGGGNGSGNGTGGGSL